MTQLAPHQARSGQLSTSHGPVAILDAVGDPADRGSALLVPGYTGSKEDFAPVLDPLAATGRRVVAIDLPGQYQSPGPDDPTRYTIDWLAEIVLEIAATLAPPVQLLGHSMGGLIARAAVIAEPDRFRSLLLLGSGPAAIDGGRKARMQMLEPLLPLGMAALYDAMEQAWAADPSIPPVPPELREFLRARFLLSSPAGLKGMGDALLAEPDRTAELRATGIPVLVCHGEYDDAWPPEVQAAMAEALGAPRVAIPDALHSPAVERPDVTVATVTEFWAAVG